MLSRESLATSEEGCILLRCVWRSLLFYSASCYLSVEKPRSENAGNRLLKSFKTGKKSYTVALGSSRAAFSSNSWSCAAHPHRTCCKKTKTHTSDRAAKCKINYHSHNSSPKYHQPSLAVQIWTNACQTLARAWHA